MSVKLTKEMKNAAEMGIIEQKYAPKETNDPVSSAEDTEGDVKIEKTSNEGSATVEAAQENTGAESDASLV